MGNISAVIVAGGSGTRLGEELPKAFVDLGGIPMVGHSLQIFAAHPSINSVVCVVHSTMVDQTNILCKQLAIAHKVSIVTGGVERWQSAFNGVHALPKETEWVLIHDAARPFVSNAVIDSILLKRSDFRCAISATPMVDTVRTFKNEICCETLNRNELVRVGTPQLFHVASLRAAWEQSSDKAGVTDEAMLMERAGHSIAVAWGDPLNFKITTPEDLILARALLAWQKKS